MIHASLMFLAPWQAWQTFLSWSFLMLFAPPFSAFMPCSSSCSPLGMDLLQLAHRFPPASWMNSRVYWLHMKLGSFMMRSGHHPVNLISRETGPEG